MTEAALNPRKNRKTMCEIMFEKFGVGQMQIGMQALLALYADVNQFLPKFTKRVF